MKEGTTLESAVVTDFFSYNYYLIYLYFELDSISKFYIIWPYGEYYIGEWVDNKREGQGEHHYRDESVYKGNWENNVRAGEGKLIKFGKTKHNGYWVNDKFYWTTDEYE